MCTFYFIKIEGVIDMKEHFMEQAIKEANKAFDNDEVPIGAVIVLNDKIIAKAYNKKEKQNSVLEHAEIIAIRKAEKKIKNWRLENCDLYVTLEPCPMCASAIQQSRINNIYYGIENSDQKNHEIIKQICKNTKTNKEVELHGGILKTECEQLLKTFFQKQRNKTNV